MLLGFFFYFFLHSRKEFARIASSLKRVAHDERHNYRYVYATIAIFCWHHFPASRLAAERESAQLLLPRSSTHRQWQTCLALAESACLLCSYDLIAEFNHRQTRHDDTTREQTMLKRRHAHTQTNVKRRHTHKLTQTHYGMSIAESGEGSKRTEEISTCLVSKPIFNLVSNS